MNIGDLQKFILYVDSNGKDTLPVKIDSTPFPSTIKNFIDGTAPHYNDLDSPLGDFIDDIGMIFMTNGLDISIVNDFPTPFSISKPMTTVEKAVEDTPIDNTETVEEKNRSVYQSGKSVYVLLTYNSCTPTVVDRNNENGLQELSNAYNKKYADKNPVYSDYNNFLNVIQDHKITKNTLNNFIKHLQQTDGAIIQERGTKKYGIIKILIHKYGSDFTLWKDLPLKDCEGNFGLPVLNQIRSMVCGSSHQEDSSTKAPLCKEITLCHTRKDVLFYKKGSPNYEFSNFYENLQITVNGVGYKTAEHLFQASKFMNERKGESKEDRIDRLQYIKLIGSQSTPGKAFVLARQKTGGGYKWRTDMNPVITAYQHISIRDDWDSVKDDVMYRILKVKFSDSRLKTLLLNTGDRNIVEDSPRDAYWGRGKNWEGKNMLGKLLMKLRLSLTTSVY
jgi:ribA/ribD-fused uncharacterized protein